jgi:hypothetical protein
VSIHDRVVDVVSKWGRLAALPDDTDQLQVIWANSGQAVPFQPDGATQLIVALKAEFMNPPIKNITFVPADLDGGGGIKTVGDLATAVGQLPAP